MIIDETEKNNMVFSSLNFMFVFLPIVFGIYFISPRKIRNFILFIASLVFYAWGEPFYVVLMLFSTILNFVYGALVQKYKGKTSAKWILASSVVLNLGILGFFKYTDFFIGNINAWFGTSIPLLNLTLPIGISFYTFQMMSYVIDVYRGDAAAQKNFVSFGAYVALFPQLVAGPIVRYTTIADQLDNRRENTDMFAYGIKRFVTGLAKKVLLANTIGQVWTQISAMEVSSMSVVGTWIGALAFTFQIYFDFSAYSDMAIGLGYMLGFKFLENFDYPYISKSITEFWRRWHISLGTWFREYVYIPLGGNRKGLVRQIFNLLIVWFCTGFWHGASWNFLIWGGYYGVLLIIEKLFLLKVLKKIPAFFSHVYTLFFVVIGWVIFGFDDMTKGWEYLKGMFGFGGLQLVDNMSLYLLLSNIVLILILIVASTPLPAKLGRKIMSLVQTKNMGCYDHRKCVCHRNICGFGCIFGKQYIQPILIF